jgi:hypothetical protein
MAEHQRIRAPSGATPERSNALPASNAKALELAFARAEESKTALMQRPDMVTGAQLADELGVSRATVDNRRQGGKLLALEFGAKRGFRFPLWQRELVEERRTRLVFEAVLERLARSGAWSCYRFLTRAAPELDGLTPVAALRAGESETVVRAAEAWAAGDQGGG